MTRAAWYSASRGSAACPKRNKRNADKRPLEDSFKGAPHMIPYQASRACSISFTFISRVSEPRSFSSSFMEI